MKQHSSNQVFNGYVEVSNFNAFRSRIFGRLSQLGINQPGTDISLYKYAGDMLVIMTIRPVRLPEKELVIGIPDYMNFGSEKSFKYISSKIEEAAIKLPTVEILE